MIFGCSKHLGLFLPADIIDFGVNAPYTGTYKFVSFFNGSVTIQEVAFTAGDPLKIPFNFNETGVTEIKIQLPADATPPAGFSVITSSDGACMFSVQGTIPTCSN